jgi:DNA-binding transcriptional MerR regulator
MSGAQIGNRERQMMTIGTFAGRSRISMRALRIYDRLGLLKPAHVDADSGYRRYRVDQLFTARLIVMLRRLDMPLPLIGQVLSAPDGAGGELVRKYWDEVERRIEVQRDLARRVQLGLEGRPLPPESRTVYERDCPRQTLLTEQNTSAQPSSTAGSRRQPIVCWPAHSRMAGRPARGWSSFMVR